MPLWFLPALIALFAIASLAAGIWLASHYQSIAFELDPHFLEPTKSHVYFECISAG